ncbi:primary-amine oxidase [Nesterenkonia suensis]
MSHKTPTSEVPHPLAPLTVDEIDALRELLRTKGLVTESTRFSYVALREPTKADLSAWTPEDPLPREASLLLTDLETMTLRDIIVDITAGTIVHEHLVDPAAEGTAPVFDGDYGAAAPLLEKDPRWIAALERRGITDLSQVVVISLSAGVFDYEDEIGRRMVRALAFRQDHPTDSIWAHPIDGVVAHVDLTSQQVLRVIETEVTHVPEESGDYLDPAVRGEHRTSLKPISITQPEGVSFTLEDGLLSWENWKVRVGFNGREGLTLHQLSFTDRGEDRPVMHRGSIAEMVVNYADPSPVHAWQNYFDVGEYQFGRLANSLELGCDCLGEITYADAVVVDDFGHPKVLKNAICIHEEDYGILWKHTDDYSNSSEVRRQRRLVISFFVTVGNYDYGFYWHLYLDGKIELECKATGIVFTASLPDGGTDQVTELAPGLGAPIHQHMFCARLDMDVDGTANAVDELDVARVPQGPGNEWGNVFSRSTTRLTTEQQAVRDADGSLGRIWRVSSTERTNRLGQPTAYELHPTDAPPLLAAEGSSVQRRAAFASHHLWVTQNAQDELHPAGRLVNLNPGDDGLPRYIAGDRPVEGEDIVLWHSFGLTHYPRPEDWPIMPVDYAGFTLLPSGFFDRNPTLDVPPPASKHWSAPADAASDDASDCSCD